MTKIEMMKLYNDPKIVPSIPLDHHPSDPKADWSKIEPVVHTGAPTRTKKKAATSTEGTKGKKTARRAKKK